MRSMQDALQHDAYSCNGFDGADPFPVARDAQGRTRKSCFYRALEGDSWLVKRAPPTRRPSSAAIVCSAPPRPPL